MDLVFKNVLVSRADSEDAAAIINLYYETSLATYPYATYGITKQDIVERFEDDRSSDGILKMSRKLANPPKGELVLVAKIGDEVVACCWCIQAAVNKIAAFYVSPERQRQGIGTKLWTESLSYMDMGKQFFVEIAVYNIPARSFYERLGFVKTERHLPEFRFKSGRIFPRIEMKRGPIPA